MKIQILFPSQPILNHIVDSFFLKEFKALNLIKDVTILLFDYSNLLFHNKVEIIGNFDHKSPVIYRGWKLTSEQYNVLFNSCNKMLINDNNSYSTYHYPTQFLHKTKLLSNKSYISFFDNSNSIKENLNILLEQLQYFDDIYPKIKFDAILKDSTKTILNRQIPYIVNVGDDIESRIFDFMSKMKYSFDGTLQILEYIKPSNKQHYLDISNIESKYKVFCFDFNVIAGYYSDNRLSNYSVLIPDDIIKYASNFVLTNKIYDFVALDIIKQSNNEIKIVWIDDAQVTRIPSNNVNEIRLMYNTLITDIKSFF